MLHPASLSGRLLEWPPLRFIGRISYGLYLWQELFFSGHFAPEFHPFGPFSHAPLNFVAVFALATVSFFLVERPCMRLGHRLEPPAVEGRPELAPAGASA
jgi:peptidoglycan/LPS O-acetylase OafA/YrhL